MSHILYGSYSQIRKLKLYKEYRRWLDNKILEYRENKDNKLYYRRSYLKELIEDNEVSSYEFIREFKNGIITI